ncbi:hypothetical protein RHCRD62_40052 [Rhodococcus sp. RD6.2]|nr:hypothetical protein RHCRD62_40052 [Rhodococcus sp. RD6.2]
MYMLELLWTERSRQNPEGAAPSHPGQLPKRPNTYTRQNKRGLESGNQASIEPPPQTAPRDEAGYR